MSDNAGEKTVEALTSRALDRCAAEAAHAAAAAFRAAGWEWSRSWDGDDNYVPDEALLALKIRRMMDDCPVDRSCGSGRVQVYRFIEDEVEQVSVSLDLGGAAGDDR